MENDLRETATNFVAHTRATLVKNSLDIESLSEKIKTIDKKLEEIESRQLSRRDWQVVSQLLQQWGDIINSVRFYKQFVESSMNDRHPIVDKILKLNDIYDYILDVINLKKEIENSNLREVNKFILEKIPTGWWGVFILIGILIVLTKEALMLLNQMFLG